MVRVGRCAVGLGLEWANVWIRTSGRGQISGGRHDVCERVLLFRFDGLQVFALSIMSKRITRIARSCSREQRGIANGVILLRPSQKAWRLAFCISWCDILASAT